MIEETELAAKHRTGFQVAQHVILFTRMKSLRAAAAWSSACCRCCGHVRAAGRRDSASVSRAPPPKRARAPSAACASYSEPAADADAIAASADSRANTGSGSGSDSDPSSDFAVECCEWAAGDAAAAEASTAGASASILPMETAAATATGAQRRQSASGCC